MLRLFGLAFSLIACGGAAQVAPPVVIAEQQPPPAASASAPRVQPERGLAIVKVEPVWVARNVVPDEKAARAWSTTPDAAKVVLPGVRHIVVQVSVLVSEAAAKKKVEAALSRIKKGEDFAKVAMEISEDPGSKGNGGAYAGEMVPFFVEELRTAYARLTPGAMTLVKTKFGWHVLKKELVTFDAILAAYGRVEASTRQAALVSELTQRMKVEEPTSSVVDLAVAKVLGEEAARSEARPTVLHVKAEGMPTGEHCGEIALAAAKPPGEVTVVSTDEGTAFVVRAVLLDPSKRLAEPTSLECESRGALDGALTPAQLRELEIRRQRKHRPKDAP